MVALNSHFAALCWGEAHARNCKSRWLWVAGLQRCGRENCMHRGANRIVMEVAFGCSFAAPC